MIELLEASAARHPSAVAVHTPTEAISFAELLTKARVARAALESLQVARVAVLLDDAIDTIAVLAAASASGVEACVYPLAADPETVRRTAENLGHTTMITNREADLVSRQVTPSEVFAFAPDESAATPGPRPHLVMTTGTSGYPKGVRHDWGRLLEPSAQIQPTPDQRWLLAYGLNQFGGLQIVLHCLRAGCQLIVSESMQPRTALHTMRDRAVTHASGTPTFWRFLLAELGADTLPALAQVTLGGEAVPGPLLERLRSRFPAAKISQIYGATEFGQNITVRDGLPGLPVSYLESGRSLDLKVVDGELFVRSSTGMTGYHGETELDPGSWRATGDLVEVTDDRVLFRGRKSDVINVGGVKVHPLPVEEIIATIPGVALARVFGRRNALTGAVVAVEFVVADGFDADDVEEAIVDACEHLPPAARPRSIRAVPSIETTGNKMTRGQAR